MSSEGDPLGVESSTAEIQPTQRGYTAAEDSSDRHHGDAERKRGKRLGDLRTGDIYERLIAKYWEMPTAFKTGKEAAGTWGLKCRDPKVFNSDVASAYRRTRHKVVP
eukprot:6811409-Prymnesium_polylepis.2